MTPPDSTQWLLQVVWLVLLAIPIACVAWTVTHEEIFREPREYCAGALQELPEPPGTEVLLPVHLRILLQPLRDGLLPGPHPLPPAAGRLAGYLIAFFALVAVANVYMSSFGRLRQEVKSEKLEAKKKEKELEEPQVVTATSLAAVPTPVRSGEGAPRERRGVGTDEHGLTRTQQRICPCESCRSVLYPCGSAASSSSSTEARISRARSASSG